MAAREKARLEGLWSRLRMAQGQTGLEWIAFVRTVENRLVGLGVEMPAEKVVAKLLGGIHRDFGDLRGDAMFTKRDEELSVEEVCAAIMLKKVPRPYVPIAK